MSSSQDTVAIIGLGLIGSSIARALRERRPSSRVLGYDLDSSVREQVSALRLFDAVAAIPEEAVRDAGIVILCVPVGAMEEAARSVAPHLRRGAVLTDVGSSKSAVASALRRGCPGAAIVPAHPIAGSDRTGPGSGTSGLFEGRWCILTPDPQCPAEAVERVSSLWRSMGAKVELMTPERHDLVVAATSHVPHLLAFGTVLGVTEMETVCGAEIMTFSGGGFRDFSRIAGADPVIWRDTFLSNREAIREVLARYRETLARLEMMIETGDVSALTATLETIRAKRLRLHSPNEQEP